MIRKKKPFHTYDQYHKPEFSHTWGGEKKKKSAFQLQCLVMSLQFCLDGLQTSNGLKMTMLGYLYINVMNYVTQSPLTTRELECVSSQTAQTALECRLPQMTESLKRECMSIGDHMIS